MDEREARILALEQAVKFCIGRIGDATDVVKVAEIFYGFYKPAILTDVKEDAKEV